MRPHGRASVSTTNPVAFAVCDRCGVWRNRNQLFWQFQWSGVNLFNTQVLVCQRCADDPQPQLKTIVLPPDPPPVINARVEPFTIDENGPVMTRIATLALEGASTISVQGTTGFSVGMTVFVYMDDGNFAQVTITTIDTGASTFGISIPLPYQSSVGQLVSAGS